MDGAIGLPQRRVTEMYSPVANCILEQGVLVEVFINCLKAHRLEIWFARMSYVDLDIC